MVSPFYLISFADLVQTKITLKVFASLSCISVKGIIYIERVNLIYHKRGVATTKTKHLRPKKQHTTLWFMLTDLKHQWVEEP